jgi:hypothetical protein
MPAEPKQRRVLTVDQQMIEELQVEQSMFVQTAQGMTTRRPAPGPKDDHVTEPEPDEFKLYDLTLDPYEERNLAHPSNADDRSRALQQPMLGLLVAQLERKRLTAAAGEVPGYRPPSVELIDSAG